MTEKRYHVVFTGRLVAGMDKAAAKSNLIIDTGLAEDKAEVLLNKRRRVVLKRFPAATDAKRMADEFERAGLVCVIEDHGAVDEQLGTGESSLITLMHRFIPMARKGRGASSRKTR